MSAFPPQPDGTIAIPSSSSDSPPSHESNDMQIDQPTPIDGEIRAEEEQVKVFQAAPTRTGTPATELPDSFFQPTAEDLQAAQSSLVKKSKNLNQRGFTLARTREEEKEKVERERKERWITTTIRIRFSDRTQIQKVFPSDSKIGPVYDFVRESLNDETRDKKFALFEPPSKSYPEHPPPPIKKPKPINPRLAKPEPRQATTLFELQLVPQSLLVVRFEEEELNQTDKPAPLKPELMQHAAPLPPPPSFAAQTPPPVETGKPVGGGASAGGTTERKIPKWLQKGLNKKK